MKKGTVLALKTILVVAAHPDDEILGVGGTVARHVAKGDQVYAMILGEGQTSRGEHREDISLDIVEELHKNTLESAQKIGYQDVFFAYFPDNRFDSIDLLDIVKTVEQMVHKLQPQIIYTHYSGDLNIDHQCTARAVLTATRPMADCCVERFSPLRPCPRRNGIMITVCSRLFVRMCLSILRITMTRRSRR